MVQMGMAFLRFVYLELLIGLYPLLFPRKESICEYILKHYMKIHTVVTKNVMHCS